MPLESTYTDHDLLIVIAERTRQWDERFTSIENRVTDIERALDRQSGFLGGAKWIWGLIASLPPTVLVFLFNK